MNQLGAQQMQTEIYCVRHNIREAEDKIQTPYDEIGKKSTAAIFIIFCYIYDLLRPIHSSTKTQNQR